ncbi:hypothetical protein ES708_28069 [subsurface metagenome]
MDLDYVKSEVRKALIDENKQWGRDYYVREGTNALKEYLLKADEKGLFDLGYTVKYKKQGYDPSEIICVKNGILYWKTLELKPWTPDIYSTIILPVRWDPEAECPYWLKTLSEWIPDKDTIRFLQNYIGLCLLPDISFETSIFLYGAGHSERSIFLNTIEALFGDAAVSIPLHKLTTKSEISYLQNKLVNICNNIDEKYIIDTELLKKIITGETLNGEFKNRKFLDFWPVCRLMFSANVLPDFKDKSITLYGCWKFIEFPITFPNNSKYKIEHIELFEKEKSGILNWAVEGLKRLKEKNEFTESKGIKRSADEYRKESDNVAYFISETVDAVTHTGRETFIPTTALYKFYVEWLKKSMPRSEPVVQIIFSKRVQALDFKKKIRTFNQKSRSVFLGMKIKDGYRSDYEYFENMLR